MEHPTSKLFSLKIRVVMFRVKKFQPRGGADSRTFKYKFKENHEDELNFKEKRWHFEDRSILMKHSCERNESFLNQVLLALGMGRGADATLMNLFNPTSGRDASHLCLISTWPKKECTIVCVIFPKRTILDWEKIRSSHNSEDRASVYDLESVFECID